MDRSLTRYVIWSAIALFLAVGTYVAYQITERQFLERDAARNASTLELIRTGLDSTLARYETLPSLLAERGAIKLVLADPTGSDHAAKVNLELKQLADQVDASDIYILNAAGDAIAASNFDKERSFLGKNYAYRPYFTGAISGELTHYFALGTVSLKRGYYFAAPVTIGQRIIGAVVVKIEVDRLENAWRESGADVIVTDANGIIFMASDKGRLFKAIRPLSVETIAAIETSRQYPISQVQELNANLTEATSSDPALLALEQAGTTTTYLASLTALPSANWTLISLRDRNETRGQAFYAVASGVMALLLVMGTIAMLVSRRTRARIEKQREANTRELLEETVETRTRDLNTLNSQLRLEIKEREAAERRLRTTQNELIQAGKLAALGQMSAALSHELNQPLAAVKSYADNAKAYLKRNETQKATSNIERISSMADRMAQLSKNLRTFARKPKEMLDSISLKSAVHGALEIMAPRLKATKARIVNQVHDESMFVRGGDIRLQQVIINLINNALDAMESADKPQVELAAQEFGDEITFTVRDHGPGIPDDVMETLFDPFFTTKPVNEGLGLGLSISYNIIQDFGGSLKARNHPDGGAEFSITLQRAEAMQSAAE
ncbi:ATP-binding protein [Pseudahrensia aquimaris]|uniref:histidine kinase n=1 Tax=Pseudahrensia aquimaris TaxID=744461 RepID=A0ABW3FDV2_9HYPH